MSLLPVTSFTALYFKLSISSSGQGLLSQSALQLNNQDAYAAAGYHSNPGLDTTIGRSGQVGAVHIYNQVQNMHTIIALICPLVVGCGNTDIFAAALAVCDITMQKLYFITDVTYLLFVKLEEAILVHDVSKAHNDHLYEFFTSLTCRLRPVVQLLS